MGYWSSLNLSFSLMNTFYKSLLMFLKEVYCLFVLYFSVKEKLQMLLNCDKDFVEADKEKVCAR